MDLKVYTAVWCRDCREAKRFLDKHSIPYTEVDIERTPGAVDALSHQHGCVFGLYGASIEDARAFGAFGAQARGDFVTDDAVCFLNLGGGGGAAGADSPDGFVGDDEFLRAFFLDTIKGAGNLPAKDGFREPGLTLVE